MIKNLKVYDALKPKTANEKIRKKRKFKLVMIPVLLTALLFTACHTKQPEKHIAPTPQDVYEIVQEVEVSPSSEDETIEDILNNYTPSEMDDFSKGALSMSVSFNESDAANINAIASNIEIDFPYDELYEVEKSYDAYKELSTKNLHVTTSYQLIKNNKLDVQALYDRVIQNNAQYKQNHKYSVYLDLDKDYIMYVCGIISDTVNAELARPTNMININDLSANLDNLCIFKSITGSNAFISNDGCMVLSPGNMETMKTITGSEDADKETIAHETFHLMQKMPAALAEQLGLENSYGFTYKFNDSSITVNSISDVWISEALAEDRASKLYDMAPATYKTKIGYMNSLNFSHSMDPSFDVNGMSDLIHQRDLEKLFEAYGKTTEAEKIEFLKMLYSVDVIQNIQEDFLDQYETKVLGHEMEEEDLIALQRVMKGAICEYFTKEFYTGLANRLTTTSSSLEDIFKVVSTFESSLNKHITYADEERLDIYKGFFKNYTDLQNAFFESISANTSLSVDEIVAAYNAFNGKMEVKRDSDFFEVDFDTINVSWFNEEENALLQTKHEETSYYKTVSINEYMDLVNNMQKNY